MSYEEARALREVEHALKRAEQDRLFYRNEMIVQKLWGIITVLGCIAVFDVTTKYLKSPMITMGVLLGPLVTLGIYLIFTKTNHKRMEETD